MGLYDALSASETGGENDPWIRTKVIPDGGSTAFGPVQITASLVKDAIARNHLSPESQAFAQQVLLPMQAKFSKYGNTGNLPPDLQVYDYGGSGNFDPSYQPAYKQLATELIDYANKQAGGDTKKFLTIWRGQAPEAGYVMRFKNAMKTSPYRKD